MFIVRHFFGGGDEEEEEEEMGRWYDTANVTPGNLD